jgi:hypothetical protein
LFVKITFSSSFDFSSWCYFDPPITIAPIIGTFSPVLFTSPNPLSGLFAPWFSPCSFSFYSSES